jgi:hypothetical protein
VNQFRKQSINCSIFNQIKYCFFHRASHEAALLDYIQEHPNATPEPPPAPAGEFDKIMREMNSRRIKPVIRRQLKTQRVYENLKIRIRIPKPAIIMLAVVIFATGTSVGVSAKRSYDFRVKENKTGKSDLVWNNDQYIITDGNLVAAYHEIESRLGIRPIKLQYVPFDFKFKDFMIANDIATINYQYEENNFIFIQSKQSIAASNNIVSDRYTNIEVYNSWIKKNIMVQKNKLGEQKVEYCASFVQDGAYYYLAGIVDEDKFIEIIQNLNY